MSSEEAALRRLEAAYVNLGGLALSRYDGVVDDLTKARAEKAAALDNYRTAIERRVLAQQPCECERLALRQIEAIAAERLDGFQTPTSEGAGLATLGEYNGAMAVIRILAKYALPPTARQTQETSG